MPSKTEVARRKQLMRAIAERERAEAEARMPLSRADLRDLFEHLDEALPRYRCHHSLALTGAFLHERGLDAEVVAEWLGEYGGFCDCEVLANVGDSWRD